LQHKSTNTNKTALLAKVVRDSGLCSRRDARTLIDAGRVKVNGTIVYSPCFKIVKTDIVVLDGKKLISSSPQPVELWLYHKPTGLITTHKDPQMRKTVFDNLPKGIISIGRLDLNSSGLLMLTNSGDFSRFMELPKNKLTRIYKVRAFGKLDPDALTKLEQGCTIDGVKYGKAAIKVLKSSKINHWLQIDLQEGKNREVRKLLASVKLTVTKLIRIQYGPFSLGNLKIGEVKQTTIPRYLYENFMSSFV